MPRATRPPATGPSAHHLGPSPRAADPLDAHALRDPLQDGPPVQRTVVETNGGTFQDLDYRPTGSGLEILLTFEPNAVVGAMAKKIGLVQTNRRQYDGKGDPERKRDAKGAAAGPRIDEERLPIMDATGAHVDQAPDIHHNPVYTAADQGRSRALTDTANPDARQRIMTGELWEADKPGRPAWLRDTPNLGRMDLAKAAPVGDEFETAAIVLEPAPNVYLGSIRWGWTARDGVVSAVPAAIELASAGVPSAAFMSAATAWNASVAYPDLVALPVASDDHPRRDAIASLDAKQVAERIAVVTGEIEARRADAARAEEAVSRLGARHRAIIAELRAVEAALGHDDDVDDDHEAADHEGADHEGGADDLASFVAPGDLDAFLNADGDKADDKAAVAMAAVDEHDDDEDHDGKAVVDEHDDELGFDLGGDVSDEAGFDDGGDEGDEGGGKLSESDRERLAEHETLRQQRSAVAYDLSLARRPATDLQQLLLELALLRA